MRLRLLLLCCTLAAFIPAFSQRFMIRDLSMGYRIGEGEPVGSDPHTISVNLKRPAAYQTFLDNFNYNSIFGNPGPVTYHRIFAQIELEKKSTTGKFWRSTSIPVGIDFSFREKQGGIGIGNQYWYTQPADTNFNTKMYWLEQNIKFAGLNTGLHRKIRIGKKLKLLSGILLQGEVAVGHRYKRWADTSSFSPVLHKYLYARTDRLPDLKGRNYFQWSLLVPLAAEINLYKKQWLIKPEVTIGLLGNRYLPKTYYNMESINAAIWIIYRRNRL